MTEQQIPADSKFRSRRYRLAWAAIGGGLGFLLATAVAMLLGKDISHAGTVLGGWAAVSGGTLGGYGFARWKGGPDV